MPRIISFAWTTPALLAGVKTVTRRAWNPDYARSFKPGELVLAYDRSPRVGGKKVANLEIRSVRWERDHDAPDSDWAAEGMQFIHERPALWPINQSGPRRRGVRGLAIDPSWEHFCAWRMGGGFSWVIRFVVK